MSFPVRRARALIVTACLAGAAFGAPGPALAQSAGDDQYQDPLAGETQTQTAPATTPSTAPDPGTTPQLTPDAGTSTGSSSSGTGSASGSAGTTTTGTTTSPAQSGATSLPNTGVDDRILAALGFGLLLCGLGLRLRTARERF